MKTTILLILLCPALLFAKKNKDINAGKFSLGLRSTMSAFSHSRTEKLGIGYGGHFRLQFTDRVNSEWFADYIRTNIGEVAHRQDVHIGWSVMYYFLRTENFERLVTPYVSAGHCFDYTVVKDNRGLLEKKDRWSAAVQAGLGTHFNLTPKFDISCSVLYMLHLGNHLDVHIEDPAIQDHTTDNDNHNDHPDGVSFDQHSGGGVEGHLLFNISLNYKIADLW